MLMRWVPLTFQELPNKTLARRHVPVCVRLVQFNENNEESPSGRHAMNLNYDNARCVN